MAAKASVKACMCYLLLTLRVFSNDAGGLFIQYLDNCLSTTINQGVHQYYWDSNYQTLYGGYQRSRNTTRHVFRIASTEDGDCLEGFDHTGYGTQQTQQRSYSSDNLQYCQSAFNCWTLFQNSLFEFQLQS